VFGNSKIRWAANEMPVGMIMDTWPNVKAADQLNRLNLKVTSHLAPTDRRLNHKMRPQTTRNKQTAASRIVHRTEVATINRTIVVNRPSIIGYVIQRSFLSSPALSVINLRYQPIIDEVISTLALDEFDTKSSFRHFKSSTFKVSFVRSFCFLYILAFHSFSIKFLIWRLVETFVCRLERSVTFDFIRKLTTNQLTLNDPILTLTLHFFSLSFSHSL
jgi:hypothetical protein